MEYLEEDKNPYNISLICNTNFICKQTDAHFKILNQQWDKL